MSRRRPKVKHSLTLEGCPKPVDHETAREFLKWCCKEIGLGFHPDTLGSEYIDADNSPTFSKADAFELDARMAVCFSTYFKPMDSLYSFCMECEPFVVHCAPDFPATI